MTGQTSDGLPREARAPSSWTVGFVGLGAMGGPMARNLMAGGVRLRVSDTDPAKVEELRVSGAQPCPLDRMAEECDAVVLMLPHSDAVEQVVLGVGGLGSSVGGGALGTPLGAGLLVIDMSSSDPSRTRALGGRVEEELGGRLVDAPVSGGVGRARTADLAIMVGGAEADVTSARPLLDLLGSSVTPTGPLGSAHAMKALNNLCSAGGFLIGVEVLLIGKAFGLDPGLMVDVLNSSTGVNNSTLRKFRQFVLSGAYDSDFGLDLLVKDLGIALSVAESTGVAAPFAQACLARWTAAQGSLGSGHDHTELGRFMQETTGVELA